MLELSIENLSKTYHNGVQALKEINLNIQQGIFGLLGPNGAGKSSLMRTLATLQAPDTGSIYLDTIDVLRQKPRLRQTLGYLPQDFGVPPKVSAENLLDYFAVLKGISNKKERKQLVKDLLEQTNLYEVRKRAVSNFSGGMKQRFGIAQALIGQPRFIIVDEPTAGLDPEERNRFHAILNRVGADKIVILSTHIVEDVSDLCKELAIMNKGEILQKGTPEDLVSEIEEKIYSVALSELERMDLPDRALKISSKVSRGKYLVKFFSETTLPGPFKQEKASLEDVYFTTLAQIERKELLKPTS